MEGDFFDMSPEGDFDIIYANFSLCFNTREVIEKKLPNFLVHLKRKGVFQIKDFHTDDPVVKKRTNLHTEWFFDLVRKNVGAFTFQDEIVFEEEHHHAHHIFTLRAVKE